MNSYWMNSKKYGKILLYSGKGENRVMEGSRGFDLNVLDFSGILNKTADLIKDSYVFITDIESDIKYITDKAAQYFNIKEQFCHDFYTLLHH